MFQIQAKKREKEELLAAIAMIFAGALFVLVNFLFGFVWPLYLLAAGALFFLAFFYPRSGLYALTFLTIIFERFFTLFSPVIARVEYKIYFPDLIIIGMLLSAIVSLFRNKKPIILQLKGETVMLLLFLGLNVVYYFLSVLIYNSNAYLSFSSFKNYAFYSLLYFLVFWNMENERHLKRFAKFFFGAAILLVGFIFFGILNGEGLWTEYTPLSTEGVRILAFTHGLYLALLFLPLLLFLVFGPKRKEASLLLFLLAIFAIGILGTMMRHIWVALGVSFFLVFFLLKKEKRQKMLLVVWRTSWPVLLGGLLILQLAFLFPQSKLGNGLEEVRLAVWQRSVSIFHAGEDQSFAWRKVVWENAWKKYRENILFGFGTGQKVAIEMNDYKDFVEVRNMHNSYLTILVQLGLVGFSFFFFFIFLHLKKLLSSKIRNDFYGLSFLSVLIFFLVAFAFQPYLETNLLALFFWINLGLIRTLNDKRDENSRNQ